ncbi:malectin domain-containing carbohydrate-binding protein [uncultured Parabacteroides sp.]|uniref:malectin domain-containing carbohydrate-binding protein n=1 Tax=uncultured Parabacteroides sp. TaxID=512312 RepID=UPI0025E271D2|nr:malectin domain-containing carbohydrate-binding protein [uncultured Parabacteroides sp.]
MKNASLLVSLYMLLMGGSFQMEAQQVKQIILPHEASQLLNFSAKEIQKYIYLRTKLFVPIQPGETEDSFSEAILLRDDSRLSDEEYSIERVGNSLYISGGSDIAVLYGVYSYAEYLGVRFSLHGDIIPDETFTGPLLDCNAENVKPLFAVRGLLPFHDFPEGPDLWNEDMYKSCITQMVKMKMNFFSLHTYPHVEPNVWIGLAEDVLPDGKVTWSYPTTLANTTRNGAWGYSAMNTCDYSSGASQLFEDSVYMSPMLGDAWPWPETQEQMNAIFNRTGEMLKNVFSFGHDLGVKSCVGLETPLSVPKEVADRLKQKGMDPKSREAIASLYEGIFTRIKRTHPLDYFWLWTPEGWTWGTPSKESIESTVEDINIARNVLESRFDSLGFGVSGWVLGPPEDKCLFDRVLPKQDFLSSLSRLCGQERLDLGYAMLPKDRSRIPVLWLEDDPALTTPQFWVGRLRADLAESYGIGCDGVIANFWRTGSIAPNLMAYAQACWSQEGWNPGLGKPYTYDQKAKGDLRKGGVGTNFFKHIKGTEDQYLFNTQRYDIEGYKINIPNGKYKVTFLFCETKYTEAGKRIFSIKIEDKIQLSDIDVFERVGGDTVCIVSTPEFEVNDYTLDMEMIPVVGPTFLSAFIIEGRTNDVNQIKGEPYKRCIDVGGGLYKDFEADLSEFESNTPLVPRDLSSTSFYVDYALAMFGPTVASKVAGIFESLDGTVGNDGFRGFKMPRPATWITGPGVINPNESSWEEEAGKYAFVDTLSMLRNQIQGKGNLERFDYWLNTFCYLRTMGYLSCLRGELDNYMKQLPSVDRPEQDIFIKEKIIPVRVELSRQWEKMMGYLIKTVSTTGELGTVINLESQTRKTYSFLSKYDLEIETALKSTLPSEIRLSAQYTSEPRMFVLNERLVLQKGEPYVLQMNVLGHDKITKAPVFKYRELGQKRFREKRMIRKSEVVFEVSAPELKDKTIEYYIEAEFEGEKLCYPSTAPILNRTWTRF